MQLSVLTCCYELEPNQMVLRQCLWVKLQKHASGIFLEEAGCSSGMPSDVGLLSLQQPATLARPCKKLCKLECSLAW